MGDRLDAPYNNYPDSWTGIYFRGTSAGNQLQYAVIRNADQAIVAESPPAGGAPKLVLQQCIIDNSYTFGILGVDGSLQATNCLISNCGQNIALGGGGSYQFTQCTAAAYSNNFIVAYLSPCLQVADEILQGSTIITGALQAGFTNCIFWGDYGNVTRWTVTISAGNQPFVCRVEFYKLSVEGTDGAIGSGYCGHDDDCECGPAVRQRQYGVRQLL